MKRAYTNTGHEQYKDFFDSEVQHRKKLLFVIPRAALNYLAASSLCRNVIGRTPFITACSDRILKNSERAEVDI